jgi:hypothetical protein
MDSDTSHAADGSTRQLSFIFGRDREVSREMTPSGYPPLSLPAAGRRT